jgi:multiple antibiotic resistance protein
MQSGFLDAQPLMLNMDVFLSQVATTLIALFPIANPIGAVPIFYTLTDGDTPKNRRKQAFSTAINVAVVLCAFFVLGQFILSFFGITLGVLQIAGGLVVSHTAWEMVAVRKRLTDREHQEAMEMEDVSFVPMAMPLVSGPGAIGVVIGMAATSRGWPKEAGVVLGILLLALLLYFFLALGEPIIKRLGKTGVGVLNRILGFFVLAIGVQLIVYGVFDILQQNASLLLRQAG